MRQAARRAIAFLWPEDFWRAADCCVFSKYYTFLITCEAASKKREPLFGSVFSNSLLGFVMISAVALVTFSTSTKGFELSSPPGLEPKWKRSIFNCGICGRDSDELVK